MKGTCLVYSSHNCCWYIHEQRIVKRALEGWANNRILFIPFSETPHANGDEFRSQRYGFDKFNWFLQRYTSLGLEVIPFWWSSNLSKADADVFFEHLGSCEVALLGGGNTSLGMRRMRGLGEQFYGDPDLFEKVLHDRQNRGLFTVGFSAGADQLCEYQSSAIDYNLAYPWGFGLIKNVIVTLHHEPFSSGTLIRGAQMFPQCKLFGLPNDSGIETSQGVLDSGLTYQIIEFLIDKSWDAPHEAFHIKTRQGTKIDHFYPDGRHWAFDGGNLMVRIIDPADNDERAYIVVGGNILDYWSQAPAPFGSVEHILESYS